MIKIRVLGAQELKQVLSLLKRYSQEEFEYSVLQKFQQLYVPMQFISHLLPPRLQFVPAIYVAVSRKQVLGLIWLSKDGKKTNRWKIDQLIIDPEAFSYDVGTQLIHYVINRYGGEGVQTFLALVDQYQEQALAILKSCGFRRCTRLHSFRHSNPIALKQEEICIKGLREAHGSDAEKLKALHTDSLVPEVRVSLEKTQKDFTRSVPRRLADRLKGVVFKRWVVEDAVHDLLLGSIEVITENYQDYYLNMVISPGWSDSYEDLLLFAVNQVLLSTNQANLYIDVYDFNKLGLEAMEKLGFERLSIAEVLVKDYWIPLEQKSNKLTSPILLFAGKTSPACYFRGNSAP